MTPEDIAALPYRPCVGAVLRNEAGQVFAAERRGMPGAWQMPQGGMDPGETPAAAALRELEEETSIPPALVALEAETADWLRYDLPAEIVPTRWGGRFRGQEQKWFLMRFLGRDADIRLETADPEFAAWAWMAPGDLLAAIVDFKRPTYEAVLAEFGLVPARG